MRAGGDNHSEVMAGRRILASHHVTGLSLHKFHVRFFYLANKNMQPEGAQVKQETGQGLQFIDEGPKFQLRFTLSGHRRSVSALKFSPDGSILASAGDPFVSLCSSH